MKTIEYRCQCNNCKGTGIYVGFAERGGAGVVCYNCKGSGFQDVVIKYDDFTGRVERNDIKRVYQTNPGISIGDGIDGDGKKWELEEFGGIPYEQWVDLPKPTKFPKGTENRGYTCPAWWYQCTDYTKKPKWDECIGCGSFSGCKSYPNKSKCWEKWDKEFGGKK